MRGKGERSEFFIFVSTLPWDESGVFPGLFDVFFSLPCGEKEVGSISNLPFYLR